MNSFLLTLLISFSLAGTKSRSLEILNALYQDQSWELQKITEDSLFIYKKDILDIDLAAFRVNKKVFIDPFEIINIISDIENYENFLTSAGALKTEKLDQRSGYIDAYQHITIDLPFFNNRDYFFRMVANKEALNNDKLIEWHLLDQKLVEKKDLEKKDLEATYLDHGAGMWLSNPSSENMFDISYRLVMDPGGSIPSMLVDMINEVSLISLFNDVLKEAISRSDKSYEDL
jgi:hypothetical protein